MAKSEEEPPRGGLPRGALLGLAALIAVSAVVAFVVLGGGDSASEETSDASELAVPWIDPDGADPIVGAVDVNPADGSIWMSTNTGLFRVADGSDEPEGRTSAPPAASHVLCSARAQTSCTSCCWTARSSSPPTAALHGAIV